MEVFIFSTCSLLDSKYQELVTTSQKTCSEMLKRDENSSCNLDFCSLAAVQLLPGPLPAVPVQWGWPWKVNVQLGNLVPSQVS